MTNAKKHHVLRMKFKNLADAMARARTGVEVSAIVREAEKTLGGRRYLMHSFEKSSSFDYFLKKNEEERRRTLGQVATPPQIAKLITELCIQTPTDKVIDPGFGAGVFSISAFQRLARLSKELGTRAKKSALCDKIYGVEIDPRLFLIGLANFTNSTGCTKMPHFFNGDFFDFEGAGVFDVGLMNPPYVRQEDINLGTSFLNKSEIRAKCLKTEGGQSLKISARSNLYVYFFVHLTNLIKDGGRIGAISSNTWLDTSFGKDLQKFLLERCKIGYIIDFAKDVFPEAAVESCITIMQKKSDETVRRENKVRFVRIKKKMPIKRILKLIRNTDSDHEDENIGIRIVEQGVLESDSKWSKFLYIPVVCRQILHNPKMVPLSSVAKVRRGLTTSCNKFYMLDSKTICSYGIEGDHIKDIISSPKELAHFSASCETTKFKVFMAKGGKKSLQRLGHLGALRYIKDWENRILASEKWASLKNKIKDRPDDWFALRETMGAPIIFSYYIRKGKSFLLNPTGCLVRDNFYDILPFENEDPLVLFGILNSTIIKLMLEMSGRFHGRGLLKVQAYELERMPIPDPDGMSMEQKENIRKLAKKLTSLRPDDLPSRDAITGEIDSNILEFLGVDIEPKKLRAIERKLVRRRTARKRYTNMVD